MIELLFVLTLSTPSCPAAGLKPGLHDLQITAGDTLRLYHLYIPKLAQPKNGWPVVFSFHPAASSAAGFAATTHLRNKAELAGFVLVEPEGYSGNFSKRSWNAGACCGAAAAARVDDVAFTRALLDKIKTEQACVDDSRVYAVGQSNGGMFAHRLACEAADLFAAVASVSGALADVQEGVTYFTCAPTKPIAVLELHGTADTCHPIGGGKGAGLDAINSKRSVLETMDEWRAREQCTKQSHIISKKGASVCRAFDGCQSGVDVMLCTIKDHGHGWPGSDKYELQTLCGGKQAPEPKATDLVWSFFSKHARP